jgi:hypothetical protein
VKAQHSRLAIKIIFTVLLLAGLLVYGLTPKAFCRSAATPWTSETNFQNLVYGSSSSVDVVRVMGQQPDEILRSEQMFPVVENFFYYDADKSGAATVFVFENGLLVGMHLKTAGNQYIDCTYFLTDNGDRQLNNPLLQNYSPYYSYFPLTYW